MSNGKVKIIVLIIGLMKEISLYKMSYFPEPYARRRNKNVELNLSNYATKSDLKTHQVLIHENVLKKDDKLDIDNLEANPGDSSKLSTIVEKNVVEKTVYDKLVKKVNAIQTIDTSDLVEKSSL